VYSLPLIDHLRDREVAAHAHQRVGVIWRDSPHLFHEAEHRTRRVGHCPIEGVAKAVYVPVRRRLKDGSVDWKILREPVPE